MSASKTFPGLIRVVMLATANDALTQRTGSAIGAASGIFAEPRRGPDDMRPD